MAGAQGQQEAEGGAVIHLAVEAQIPAETAAQLPGERQAEADTRHGFGR